MMPCYCPLGLLLTRKPAGLLLSSVVVGGETKIKSHGHNVTTPATLIAVYSEVAGRGGSTIFVPLIDII